MFFEVFPDSQFYPGFSRFLHVCSVFFMFFHGFLNREIDFSIKRF